MSEGRAIAEIQHRLSGDWLYRLAKRALQETIGRHGSITPPAVGGAARRIASSVREALPQLLAIARLPNSPGLAPPGGLSIDEPCRPGVVSVNQHGEWWVVFIGATPIVRFTSKARADEIAALLTTTIEEAAAAAAPIEIH
jgi:hypothetical protein